MFNAGPNSAIKNGRINLKSKSDLVLKLYLTEEQKNWVERLSHEEQVPMSKCIVNLIDAHRDQKRHEQKLDQILEDLQNVQSNQKLLLSNSSSQLEIILTYLKEVFRESAANLYRLNAMVDEFADSEKIRAEVNTFVRQQESMMRSKALQIHEQNS